MLLFFKKIISQLPTSITCPIPISYLPRYGFMAADIQLFSYSTVILVRREEKNKRVFKFRFGDKVS